MGNLCKGKCSIYRANKTTKGHYFLGHKRCQICDIFVKWDGSRCPCCSTKLRIKPHNKIGKEKFKEKENSEIINGC